MSATFSRACPILSRRVTVPCGRRLPGTLSPSFPSSWAARRLPEPFVLCHTDIGPENLLIDEHEALWVLDWDDATVAPPEHDLQAALGDGEGDFGRFLAVYKVAGGAQS